MASEDVAIEFGKRIAAVMLELRSSNIYFVICKAYPDIVDWEQAEALLESVVAANPRTPRKES